MSKTLEATSQVSKEHYHNVMQEENTKIEIITKIC